MGLGIGLFGRMTTDDSEEHIHRRNERISVGESVDLQVRMRQSHTLNVEMDLSRTQRTLRETQEELHQAQEKAAKLEEQNEYLREQREALRETALNIAIDRRAIFNTIEYLRTKWGQPNTIPVGDEIQEQRDREIERLSADDSYVDDMIKRIDESVDKKVKTKRAKKR